MFIESSRRDSLNDKKIMTIPGDLQTTAVAVMPLRIMKNWLAESNIKFSGKAFTAIDITTSKFI